MPAAGEDAGLHDRLPREKPSSYRLLSVLEGPTKQKPDKRPGLSGYTDTDCLEGALVSDACITPGRMI